MRPPKPDPDPEPEKEIKIDPIIDSIPFLQFPKSATCQPALKVKEIVVEQIYTDEEIEKREGTEFFEKDIKLLIKEDADIYARKPDGEKILLAKFRKNIISRELIELAWKAFAKTAAASRARGAAAGPIKLNSPYWKKRKPVDIDKWSAKYKDEKGKISKMVVNNNVMSSVLGYFEETAFMKVPCRLTSYTMRFFEQFQEGLPFIEKLDSLFKFLIPDRYKAQKKLADKQPSYRIKNTAFSSLTVNRNFQTHLHKDAGDTEVGFGNLSCIEVGKYHGGYTMFPQYGVGFDLRTGDFLEMDVHQWHCNCEMKETKDDKEYNKHIPVLQPPDKKGYYAMLGQEKSFSRLSFVCYLRSGLLDCHQSETKSYYKRIGFDEKTGLNPKKNKTRKVKRT